MSQRSSAKAVPDLKPVKQSFIAHTARDGFYVGGYDVNYSDDIGLSVEQGPGLFLGLMLSGRSTSINLNGIGEFEIPVGRPIIMNFGETTQCTNFYKAGEHCAGVGINLPPEFFHARQNDGLGADLGPLKELLNKSTDIEVLQPCEEMARLANLVLAAASNQAGAALMLEGLGFMLLSRFCINLAEAKEQQAPGDLTKVEWQRIKKITDHLEQNLAETPSLSDLSRLAGVNQTTLSDHFKSAHGETIFSYLRNKRLDAARIILRTESASVTDVSFRVGFSSSTSFTTAYRRRYGYPPSQETSES
ncbi:MAG: AraC family transcriptional regulator [Pseudomonadota bacterium]